MQKGIQHGAALSKQMTLAAGALPDDVRPIAAASAVTTQTAKSAKNVPVDFAFY